MTKPKTYKWCVVPKCVSTTFTSPEKLFFLVPFEPKMRQKWMQVIKRDNPPSDKSAVYCCEDHFDIENDMENYIKFKLVGGLKKLKKGVVPHKFECQRNNEDESGRSAVEKRNHIKKIKTMFNKDPAPEDEPEEIFVVCRDYDNSSDDDEMMTDVAEDPLENDPCMDKSKRHKAIQVKIKKRVENKATITQEKFFKRGKNVSINIKPVKDSTSVCSFKDSTLMSAQYEPEKGAKCSESEDTEWEQATFKSHMQKAALLSISREPQLLLGLPKQCYFCINILCETMKSTPRDVMITLKKVRLHQSNALLALDFGLSTSTVATIIRRTVPDIASSMKSLIYFPPSIDVLLNLPIPFRRRFSQVQSIIDCFEIQIEKPVNAVKQTLTWSDYKSCNTMKYLISITPDGLINFISEGYGGRATDSLIFEDCGILQSLPKGAAVLANRGFKNIAHLLQQHGHILIRPPSVSAVVKPTKKEVLETQNYAAIRVHVERAIGRLRTFGFMLPHACVDIKQIDILDFIVITACGIVNLQDRLFNQQII